MHSLPNCTRCHNWDSCRS